MMPSMPPSPAPPRHRDAGDPSDWSRTPSLEQVEHELLEDLESTYRSIEDGPGGPGRSPFHPTVLAVLWTY